MWEQIIQYIQHINWASPSWDIFIVLFFVISAFIYGISLGRDRIIVIMISVYMSLAVVNYAPFLHKDTFLNLGNNFVVNITSFLAGFVLLFFLFSRSALLKTFSESNTGSWWQVLLFSFLQVGLLISIALSFLPSDTLNYLSDFTIQVFATENARFAWVISPILMMAFLEKGSE